MQVKSSIFDNKDVLEDAIYISEILELTQWDLSSYQEVSLGKLIYIKFIENLFDHYHQHSFTSEQEKIIYDFLSHFSSFNKKLETKIEFPLFAKIMKGSDCYYSFCYIEKLARR